MNGECFFSAFCAVPWGGLGDCICAANRVVVGGGMIIQRERFIRHCTMALSPNSMSEITLRTGRFISSILTCWPAYAHTCLPACCTPAVGRLSHGRRLSPLSLGRRQPTYLTYLLMGFSSARRMHAMCAVKIIPARRKRHLESNTEWTIRKYIPATNDRPGTHTHAFLRPISRRVSTRLENSPIATSEWPSHTKKRIHHLHVEKMGQKGHVHM